MAVTVGFAGPNVRSDVRVIVSEGTGIEIQSIVAAMYGDAIRSQAQDVLASFGNPAVRLEMVDSGALPFILQGRLEAALALFLNVPLPISFASPPQAIKDRSRRSRLYIPGNQPKFMPNAGIYGADCIIFDLEDSVPQTEKFAARALVRSAIASLDLGHSECMVRINSGEAWLDDIAATCLGEKPVDTYVIPKVESADTLRLVADHLDACGSPAQLLAILESATGVQNAVEIASSTPRLVAMTLGVEDYLTDIRATDKAAAIWANGAILNACRAAGISPLGSVTSEVSDEFAIEHFARNMANLGFDGVGCLHPRQVAPAHRGFAPSQEALDEAQEIVSNFEDALKVGKGAISVRGKMVDEPIYQRALRTVKMGSQCRT